MRVCAPSARLAAVIAAVVLGSAGPALAQAPSDADLDAMFAKAARSQSMLRLLVQRLPKGADLHNHGGGHTYAEDMIAWSAKAGGCFSVERQSLTPGPCLEPGMVPLDGLVDRNAELYSDIIDALSTRRFELGVGDPEISGHRRFFRSFRRFSGGGGGEPGQALATALEQAGLGNVHYLELMLGVRAGAPVVQASSAEPWNEADMAGRLARLQPAITAALPLAAQEAEAVEKGAHRINRCDTANPGKGCEVTLRLLTSVGRNAAPETVFGQMAFAFALVDANPLYVGINIAAPEDYPVSTRDYSLHMRMFSFFKQRYPDVPLTLHSGELTLGLVAPRDLRFHIREAIEIAGAKRIGHGVSIAYEDNASELLAKMAREKVAVEINLTSNDVILGVKGREHPLALYMAAGVPVALSTDDEGVSRHDMTREYMRAVVEQGLSYTQLRKISRDSVTYSFLEGESLWDAAGQTACAAVTATPTGPCDTFLKTSPKAREQYRLDLSFADYEARLPITLEALSPARFPAAFVAD